MTLETPAASLPQLIYGVADEMNPSKRSTMEDAYVIEPDLVTMVDEDSGVITKYSLLAIYDGHGGRDICDYLQATFHEIVKQELSVPDGCCMSEKLERSFLLADITSHAKAKIDTSGATVALCLLEYQQKDNHEFVCTAIHAANAGDARITYGSSTGRAKRLTHDHLAHDKDEVKRIEQAGGFVMRGRVLGVLAVARSLGDFGMKQFVIAKPYVSCTERDGEEDTNDFLIIACDGLWDVFKDQEAVNAVRNWKRQGMDCNEIARMLCKEALVRGSTDNVTVIVTWL